VHHLARLVLGAIVNATRVAATASGPTSSPASARPCTKASRGSDACRRDAQPPGPIGADEVERIVRDQLVEILGVDPDAIAPETRLREDLDADDFALIDLVEAVEVELGERSVGLSIDDDDLVEMRTVRDAVDCVMARVQAS
jgi:acyl carrier protein